jgi:hypothetical protein
VPGGQGRRNQPQNLSTESATRPSYLGEFRRVMIEFVDPRVPVLPTTSGIDVPIQSCYLAMEFEFKRS